MPQQVTHDEMLQRCVIHEHLQYSPMFELECYECETASCFSSSEASEVVNILRERGWSSREDIEYGGRVPLCPECAKETTK